MSSSQKVDLKVEWCNYEAAKYAVMHWHYSGRMPMGKMVKIGVWECDCFIGCVIFSLGTNKSLGQNYGLRRMQACELTRIALSGHRTFVSQIVAQAIRMLKGQSTGLRLIVSYADPLYKHIGKIYQASNWIYTGMDSGQKDERLRSYKHSQTGRIIPWRSMSNLLMKSRYQCSVEGAVALGWEPLARMPKHKYLYPLDRAMRRQIAPLAKPYPKRAGG